MTRVSLRNIAAHKLRLALTVLAVVLGTAFIAGSLMFTNMLGKAFDSAVSSQFDGVDAVIRSGDSAEPVTQDLLGAIEQLPTVSRVNQGGSTTVIAARTDGEQEAIQMAQGGASTSVFYGPEDSVGPAPDVVEGRAPEAAGEAVVNRDGAEKYGITVDEKLTVVDPSSRREYTIVGLYDDEATQATSLAFQLTPDSYNEFYTDGDSLPEIVAAAKEGVTPDQLVDALRAAHPGFDVRTGDALAKEASKQIRDGLSFVSYFLTAFGLVGLLVGTFLIANTFSMIVAQRTKEFALLRALGSSRRQISRSVTTEAFFVGLIGSVVGVVAGALLVLAIKAIMGANGMLLPDGGVGLTPSAVAVPVVVGVAVTMLSAWAPARRAGRVQPVEAMRSSEAATPQPLRARTIFGVLLLSVGFACAAGGVAWTDGTTANRASLVGVAAVAVIVGVFLAGPALSLPIVPPLGRVIGAPFGAVGKLASTNTRRNPRRTSATAFSLMLGIALVTVIGMLGATMKQSVADVSDSEITSDYVLSGPTNGSFPVPADLPNAVREADGVGEVVSYSEAPVTINGEYSYAMGSYGATPVFDGNPADVFALTMVEGDSTPTAETVVVPRDWAEKHGLKLGDAVTIAAPGLSPSTVEVKVGGIFEPSNVIKGAAVSRETALKLIPQEALTIQMVGANGDGTGTFEELRSSLEDAVRPYIVVQVRSAEDMSGEVSSMIDQMLYILYALLSLAVVIAVLGIVNTLTLSVIERRQEIGMLRAVGTQRGQVRVMVILESVQMAVFGALAGILMGLGLGWAFLRVLSDQGLENIVVPWPLIAMMLGGSVVVGVLAALWPAQRATKTPPLDAIAE